MKFGLGILVLSVTVYTAKSLSKNSENIRETQIANMTPRTDFNPSPQIASFFKKFNLLPLRNLNESSEEIYENNEIEQSDVIEIEVPIIGKDFRRLTEYQSDNIKVKTAAKGYIESAFTTTSQSSDDISQAEMVTKDILTFSTDFQTPTNEETTTPVIETTQPVVEETSSPVIRHLNPNREHIFSDIGSTESKLMEQWKSADNLIDGSFESKIFTLNTQRHSKYPFNVKIIVNNEDERKSCKAKSSCSQVSFSQSRYVDPQFYSEYSDEDLFFQSESDRYAERPNQLKARNARRAADDFVITPAPRLPQISGIIKKPKFIEQLENESSLERSERINKNLDGFMRFITIVSHVDKFVSDRARGAVKKLAYLSGDDNGDDFTLGSKRRSDIKRKDVDPFT